MSGAEEQAAPIPELQVLRESRRRAEDAAGAPEGLRERKKRRTRQQISDTATQMFLEHGFDEVRVTDVAAACGVSEKTVYNYFPTKESLLFDREPDMIEAVRRSLGPDAPSGSPVDALAEELVQEIDRMVDGWADLPDSVSAASVLHRFHELIEQSPSLRAAYRDMAHRITQVAAAELANRAGLDPLEPEPQIAATAICALWGVMFRGLEKNVAESDSLDEVRAGAAAEVRRAARLIDTGLWSFGLEVQGTTSSQHVKQAADAADAARKQVVVAVRVAKSAWAKASEDVRTQQRAEVTVDLQSAARETKRKR